MNDDSSVCVVIMGLKINFKKMKHRNNSVDNFGNSGISWHGALVFYSVQVYIEPDLYEIRQEKIYIDHTNTLYIKQDADCAILPIEAILNFIKIIFPNITGVIPQSGNARLYQNYIVLFFIHLLIIPTGIFILVTFKQIKDLVKSLFMETTQQL